MNGWGWFFLILLLIALAYGAWAGYHFYTYKRINGVPPPAKTYIPFPRSGQSTSNYPSPRSANPIEWIKDQFNKLRNKRTHQGAYEETGGREQQYGHVGGGNNTNRRGRGLEDDAWDTRVGNEDPYGASGPGGYNEEQELGLAPTPGYANDQPNPYGRTDYMNQSTSYGGGQERGRAQLATTEYDRERPKNLEDPFGDRHEAASMRS